MAQKVDIRLVDDIDGEEAERTVEFSFDGAAYEIDLSADNIAAFEADLARWVGAARQGGRSPRAGRGSARRAAGPHRRGAAAGEVRAWARENGYQVSDRGRIPAEVKDAYEAAH